VPLPASLAGKRCLDVGTWDGFWAFEMERRGAAEVVAVDILDPQRWDWPPRERRTGHGGGLAMLEAIKGRGEAFGLAREALGSRVERLDLSVYDLDPVELGHFDVVFLGSLLLHLRDPVRALERLRSVCAGEAIIADTVELGRRCAGRARRRAPRGLERPWWWQPNRAALLQMVQSAGFTIRRPAASTTCRRARATRRRRGARCRGRALQRPGREEIVVATRGIPHVAVRATP
jgi:tRNA (mo5U34)-methyltransferase